MASDDFNRELVSRLAGFVDVYQSDEPRGRFVAQLNPYMINLTGGDLGVLPPGQMTTIGSMGYETWSEATECLDSLPPQERRKAARRPEIRAKWAARPFFHERDTAMAMMLNWLMTHRRDIVESCAAETRRAIAWRAARAA